jgi:hypothetical protein
VTTTRPGGFAVRGRPGIHIRADLGATYPTLLPIAAGLLAAGAVFGAGAALLIAGAIRRAYLCDA